MCFNLSLSCKLVVVFLLFCIASTHNINNKPTTKLVSLSFLSKHYRKRNLLDRLNVYHSNCVMNCHTQAFFDVFLETRIVKEKIITIIKMHTRTDSRSRPEQFSNLVCKVHTRFKCLTV